MIRIALFDNELDREPKPVELPWEELAELLAEAPEHVCRSRVDGQCESKFGPAWSPADYPDGALRSARLVRAVSAAVLDLDHLSEAQLVEAVEKLQAYTRIVHATHSDKPGDRCFRVVLRLSRPVPAEQYPLFRQKLLAVLALPGVDASTKDASRLFFLPSRPQGAGFDYESAEGLDIDVDLILGGVVGSAALPLELPAFSGPVDLKALKASVSRVGLRGDHPLASMLAGASPADPGGRDNAVNRAAASLAFRLPAGTPPEAAVELVRAGLQSMQVQPEGLSYWVEKFKDSFGRAALRHAEQRARDEALADRLRTKVRSSGTSAPVEEGEDWRERLVKVGDKVQNSTYNAGVVLRYAEELRGTLEWDVMRREVRVKSGPLAGDPVTLPLRAQCHIYAAHGINMPTHAVGEVLLSVARETPVNDVEVYLRALAWDKVERTERWLVDYCGVDDTPYARAVGKRWLLSAVARALRPGCQVDTVLILEGPQGVGKTSVFRALASPWCAETTVSLGDKDSRMLASRYWVVELGELASFSRAHREAMLSFLSATNDSFRPPYGRAVEDVPRQGVFVGTTNESEYLSGSDGNRRFWPVRVGEIDLAGLRADRDQLWAEAVALYDAGERWHLEGDEVTAAAAEQEERALDDGDLTTQVAAWWYGLHTSKRPEWFSTVDLARDACGVSSERLTRALTIALARACKALGFKRERRLVAGGMARGYISTTYQRNAPQVRTREELLRMVGRAKLDVM